MRLDIDALIVGGLIAGAAIGIIVWNILVFIWPFAKAFLHTITA